MKHKLTKEQDKFLLFIIERTTPSGTNPIKILFDLQSLIVARELEVKKEAYKRGVTDFCKTFRETLKLMDSSGTGKFTTEQILGFIDQAEKLTG